MVLKKTSLKKTSVKKSKPSIIKKLKGNVVIPTSIGLGAGAIAAAHLYKKYSKYNDKY